MAGSIREALEAATLEHTPDEEKQAVATELGIETKPEADDKSSAAAVEAKPEKSAPTAKVDGSPAAGDKAKPDAAAVQGEQQKAPEVKTSAKAPVSWRPQVRDAFAKLPPEVQEEVTRREQEINNGLREASEARKLHREFQETVTPYLAQIQAEGATPMQAFKSLLNTAHVLRAGTPQQKALMTAQTILQFGVPVELLDQALAQMVQGRVPQNDPVMSAIEQKLAPITNFMQQMESVTTKHAQQREQTLEEELNTFANDPKNEFYADVAGDIADLLEFGAKRGQKITLQEAYDRAILLHPEISEVVSRRKLAEQATQKSTAALKAKKAGASVSGGALPQNEGKPAPAGNSRRAALEAAFDAAVEQGQLQ